MKLVHLDTLPPGSRFRTESGREGELLRVGSSSCRVRYGSAGKRTVTKTRPGHEPVTFDVTVPAEELDIAPRTEVTVV